MKTNSNLILHHIVWRGLYFFSVLLLNIGIARFFAAEKSGQIFFIVNNLALILLLVSISLESGSAYFIAAGNLNASQMGRFCGIWAIAASLPAIAGWAAILYYTGSAYLEQSGFLAASFLFILGVLLTTYFTALFYARKEFGLPNKILLLINGLLMIVLIAGYKLPFIRTFFIQIYFASFFLQGMGLMIFFLLQEKIPSGSWFPSQPVLKKVFQYSLAALLANGIYFLVNRIDYWFVQYYCTEKDLGNYIQASKLAQMLFIMPGILASTLFPLFASGGETGNAKQLTAVIRFLLLINATICLGIICTGWYLIPLIFGVTFSNMYLLFLLLIPGILCVTLNYPMTAWFSADKRIGINIRGSLLALMVICAGDIILLPRFGIKMASVVSSAGFFSYACYTILIYRKRYPVPLKDFLIIQKSDLNQILQTIRNKIPAPAPENPIV